MSYNCVTNPLTSFLVFALHYQKLWLEPTKQETAAETDIDTDIGITILAALMALATD